MNKDNDKLLKWWRNLRGAREYRKDLRYSLCEFMSWSSDTFYRSCNGQRTIKTCEKLGINHFLQNNKMDKIYE